MRWPLQRQLAGVLLILILALCALAAYSYLFIRDYRSAEATAALQAQTRVASARFRYALDSAGTLAELIHASGLHGEGCDPFVARLLGEGGRYNVIAVGDAAGDVHCSAPKRLPPPNVSDRPWFRAALAERMTRVGDFQLSRTTGEANLIVAEPLVTDGGVRVVGIGLRLAWLSGFIGELGAPPGTVVGIIDEQRRIIARHPNHDEWLGRPVGNSETLRYLEHTGADVLRITARDGVARRYYGEWLEAGGQRFFVYTGIPEREITQLATSVTGSLGGAILALSVLLVALIGYLARQHVVRPLQAATGFADRVATGAYGERLDARSATAEVDRLVGSLNTMAVRLARHARELTQACRVARLGHWRLDRRSGRLHLSAGARALLGLEPDRDTNTPAALAALADADDRQALVDAFATLRAGRQPEPFEVRLRGHEGAVVHCYFEAAPATGAAVVHGIVQDVSERRRLEMQYRQAQRLEAVGQLTGGVAHDFNNLLTVILGNAELLEEALARQPELQQLAQTTHRAAERGAALTRHLLAFARQQPLEPKPTDVDAVLAGMDHLLRRALGEAMDIELVRGGGLWQAMVDEAQLENAILNLCLNARDAMPGGGRLTIETANAHLDADYAACDAELEPGQYVLIAVSDTGTGMDRETLQRAFEPFFSTKRREGGGNGLGLSMVFGLAKQSRGHVSIYSEPGEGTTVKLYLPRAYAAPEPEATPAVRAEPEASARILLVEDNELVRAHVVVQLEALGHEVVSAGAAREALAVLELDDGFDLLFTDVVLPSGMSGRDLAERAAAMQPGLPVLFTSGYTENAIVHHGRLDPGVHLLPKPFERRQLATKIREVLHAQPRS